MSFPQVTSGNPVACVIAIATEAFNLPLTRHLLADYEFMSVMSHTSFVAASQAASPVTI